MKTKLIAGAILATTMLLLVVFVVKRSGKETARPIAAPDMRNHPIYSSYQFPQDANVIRFGLQPLGFLMGNIGEIVRRDLTLKENLQKLDLSISFHDFVRGPDANFFVLQGDLDGAVVGDMPMLQIASELELIAPSMTVQGTISVVANREMLIGNLKGKRVAFPFGSTAHHLLLEALESDAVNVDQVALVPMDVSLIPEAFQKGTIDAFAAWEPNVSMARKAKSDGVVIHRARSLGFTYFRKEFASAHPEAIRQILAAEIRAVRWMLTSRSNLLDSWKWVLKQGSKLGAQGFDLEPNELASLIEEVGHINLVPIISEEVLKNNGHLHSQFSFAQKLGIISHEKDWETIRRCFDREILKQVLDNSKRYQLDEFRYEQEAH